MPAIAYHVDKCQTAEAVLEAARAVRAKRWQIHRKPVVVEAAPVPPPAPAPVDWVLIGRAMPNGSFNFPRGNYMAGADSFEVDTSIPPPPSIEKIQRAVCRETRISKLDLLSRRRTAAVVMPRQIAMALAKLLTGRSLPEIGRHFGGMDHTTVLHAVRKMQPVMNEIACIAVGPTPLNELVKLALAARERINPPCPYSRTKQYQPRS